MRYGKVCPSPPTVAIKPQMTPRTQGRPRPVSLPSSERASAKPMLIPAPMPAAGPTRNVSHSARSPRSYRMPSTGVRRAVAL